MHLPNSCRESWRFCSSPRGAHLSFCLFVEPLSEFLHTWRLLKKRLRNWADEGISSGAFFARETLSTKYRVFFLCFSLFCGSNLDKGLHVQPCCQSHLSETRLGKSLVPYSPYGISLMSVLPVRRKNCPSTSFIPPSNSYEHELVHLSNYLLKIIHGEVTGWLDTFGTRSVNVMWNNVMFIGALAYICNGKFEHLIARTVQYS